MAELDKRDLTDVPTASLLALALKYGESLKDEYQPRSLQGVDLSFEFPTITTPNTCPV